MARFENDSTSTEADIVISLDPNQPNPVRCSECGRRFIHYLLFSDFRLHPCAVLTSAMPLSDSAAGVGEDQIDG